MAQFGAQIKSLTGIDSSNSTIQTYLTQWLTDGHREIISVLPINKLEECTDTQILDSTTTQFEYTASGKGRVMSVSRSDGTYNQICRKVNPSFSSRVQNPNDIMYYATNTDPVYYMKSSSLTVYPSPTDSEPAEVIFINLPSVSYSSESIEKFLNEAEYLVVNYASIKALSYLMNQISGDELDLVTDFADANNWLNTEEDSEMVSSRINVISAQINDFTTKRRDKDTIYKWYKDQYSLLKQDYAIGLKMLTTGTLSAEGGRGGAEA